MSGVCDVWVGGERGSEEVGERGLRGLGDVEMIG